MLQRIKRSPVKFGLIVFAVLAAASLIYSVVDAVQRMHTRRENTRVSSAFLSGDTVYTVRRYNDTLAFGHYRQTLIAPQAQPDDYDILPAGCEWSAALGRFVYPDGKKIKTCDLSGADRQTVWTAPEGRCTEVCAVFGATALVRYGRGSTAWSGYDWRGPYLLLDLTDGSAIETQIMSANTVTPLCVSDGWLYGYGYGSISSKSVTLLRLSLETGESETLCTAADTVRPAASAACVCGGYLYYADYGGESVFRVSIDGSGVQERVTPLRGASWLGLVDGTFYALFTEWPDDAARELVLCAVEPEKLAVKQSGVGSTTLYAAEGGDAVREVSRVLTTDGSELLTVEPYLGGLAVLTQLDCCLVPLS